MHTSNVVVLGGAADDGDVLLSKFVLNELGRASSVGSNLRVVDFEQLQDPYP